MIFAGLMETMSSQTFYLRLEGSHLPCMEKQCLQTARRSRRSLTYLQTLGLTDTLASLLSTNYTLVVPSDEALSGATGSLAALAADPTALNQAISAPQLTLMISLVCLPYN